MPKSYQICIGCHGIHGEKNTLAPSIKPNRLTRKEIIFSLNSYQRGKIDRANKSMIMRGFAKRLSQSDIQDIAFYLSQNRAKVSHK
jgi:cytochrome c553